MSSTKVEKSKIIYERLKSAYGFSSDEALGEVFGISKQGVNKRKKRGYLDPDEIERIFPDVNRGWLRSENLNDLESLPVRNPDSDKYEIRFNQLKNQISEEGKPDNAEDLLLEVLEEEAEKIRGDLGSLVSRIQSLRYLKKSEGK